MRKMFAVAEWNSVGNSDSRRNLDFSTLVAKSIHSLCGFLAEADLKLLDVDRRCISHLKVTADLMRQFFELPSRG